jgi:hypothetical protein
MRTRDVPVCPEKTDEVDGRADDGSRSQFASHRVFGNVRSIDPEIFPFFLFDTLSVPRKIA